MWPPSRGAGARCYSGIRVTLSYGGAAAAVSAVAFVRRGGASARDDIVIGGTWHFLFFLSFFFESSYLVDGRTLIIVLRRRSKISAVAFVTLIYRYTQRYRIDSGGGNSKTVRPPSPGEAARCIQYALRSHRW